MNCSRFESYSLIRKLIKIYRYNFTKYEPDKFFIGNVRADLTNEPESSQILFIKFFPVNHNGANTTAITYDSNNLRLFYEIENYTDHEIQINEADFLDDSMDYMMACLSHDIPKLQNSFSYYGDHLFSISELVRSLNEKYPNL